MQWRWSGARRTGSMERARNNFLSGGTKFNIFIILVILAVLVWGGVVFTAPYLRKSRLENIMEDWMREYRHYGYNGMIEEIIKEAKKIKNMPELTKENFKFEGDVGVDSTLRCEYTEFIRLPRDRYYKLDMVAEKTIKIPYE